MFMRCGVHFSIISGPVSITYVHEVYEVCGSLSTTSGAISVYMRCGVYLFRISGAISV